MRSRLDHAVSLTVALGLGLGAVLPAHGETAKATKVGRDLDAKTDKSVFVVNDSAAVWTFGVLAQDKQNEDTKGSIEIWQSGPSAKHKPTLVRVANWAAAGSITLPPGAEILVAPKPAGTLFRDPIQRTCYVKDSKGAMVYYVVNREVKDKTPRIDYLLKSRALYASQFTAKETTEGNLTVTTKAIGNVLSLESKPPVNPMLTLLGAALPKSGSR